MGEAGCVSWMFHRKGLLTFPKTISEEIEQKALRPIASELRQKTGLEVKLIYYSKQPSSASAQKIETSKTPSTSPRETPEPAKPQISSAEKEGPVVDLQSFKIKTDRPLSPLTFAPAMKDEKTTAESLAKKEVLREIPATPFILHQENPTAYPSIRPNGSTAKAGQAGSPQRSQETPAIKSSLTMKVQNFYQSSPGPERTAPKPVSIKFETSPSGFNAPKTEQPININKQDAPPAPLNDSFHESSPELPPMPPTASNSNEIRVVHYSDLRTPLNNLGISKNSVEKDNVLDLRKIVK